jgi:CHAT domain-containing protein
MTTILRRKGRVLDAMTDSLGALRARLAPGDQALLDDLAAARSKLARELLSSPKAEGSASSSIAKLEDEVERLEAAVSAKSAEFRVVTTVVTLERVQAALPEDTTLVEIVAYRDELPGRSAAEPRYAAYLLRRSGPPEAVDLGPVAHIDAQVSAFRAALSDPARRDVVSLGRALDELVMRPVRTLLKGARSIAISPDGALNLLPFGALVDEDGRFLVERASFTYLTSGRDLLRQGIRAASRQGAMIVANPRFDLKDAPAPVPVEESGRRGEEGGSARGSADLARLAAAKFTPLPGTAEEAIALQSVLRAPKVLTGSAATKKALQALHGPGILHIATHGFFLDDRAASGSSGRGLELEAAPPGPLTSSGRPPDGGAASPRAWQSLESPLIRSGLALAGANGAKADGVLTALEAAGLDLYGTELVVLSACETGVGSATTGDGVYGLRRALVIAGAQTQVMSLWKVDDEATRDLMIAYYGELRGGGGRGASMHKVQLAMLGRKETSHPYFWGAFIVSGDPGRLASLAGPSSVPPPRGPRGCACVAAGAPAPLDEPSASAAGARPWAFLLALAAVTSLARRSRGRLRRGRWSSGALGFFTGVLSVTLVACSGPEESGGQPAGGSGGAGSTASSAATASTGSGGAGEGGAGQGGGGQGGGGQGGGGGGESPQGPCDLPHETEVNVDTADELTDALSGAKPGTLIRLAPGTYEGNFKASAAGAPDNPISVCGPREAVLDGGTTATGYVVHLDKVSGWILSGFTVTRGKKGVMLDESSENLLTGLLIHDIGEEAVHFRRFSSQNTISLSEIRDTGKETPGFGEGVYIGSAVSNWDSITGSSDVPDTSDNNKVLTTLFGPGITAEHIDVKEGTTGGEVRGNTFYGAGISGANFADSWMDVKGNGYQIEENTGDGSPNDGFQTHVAVSGWGNDNVFSKNTAGVNGPGFGFSVAKSSQGNVVKCDNVVTGAAAGFANVDCVP